MLNFVYHYCELTAGVLSSFKPTCRISYNDDSKLCSTVLKVCSSDLHQHNSVSGKQSSFINTTISVCGSSFISIPIWFPEHHIVIVIFQSDFFSIILLLWYSRPVLPQLSLLWWKLLCSEWCLNVELSDLSSHYELLTFPKAMLSVMWIIHQCLTWKLLNSGIFPWTHMSKHLKSKSALAYASLKP